MKKLIPVIIVLCLVLGAVLYFAGSEESEVPAPAALDIPAPAEAPEAVSAPAEAAESSAAFSFSTVDSNGNAVDESIFGSASVIMINLWEPWCGPCVREMPELQELYENYADKGLLILGVYSTESGVQDVLASTGVKYPALALCSEFTPFTTAYVPTTVFISPDGTMLTEAIIGANSYDQWAAMVEELL